MGECGQHRHLGDVTEADDGSVVSTENATAMPVRASMD